MEKERLTQLNKMNYSNSNTMNNEGGQDNPRSGGVRFPNEGNIPILNAGLPPLGEIPIPAGVPDPDKYRQMVQEEYMREQARDYAKKQTIVTSQEDEDKDQKAYDERLRAQGKRPVPKWAIEDMWMRREGKADVKELSDTAKLAIDSGEFPPEPARNFYTVSFNEIDKANNIEQIRDALEKGLAGQFIRNTIPKNPQNLQPRLDLEREIKRIMDMTDLGEMKMEATRLVNDAQGRIIQDRQRERYYALPQSIQQLAEIIMESEDPDKYGERGTNPLLDEKGNFKPENFLLWLRDKMLYYHEFDPDSEINIFSAVHVLGPFRTISLQEMIQYSGLYFKDRKTGKVWNDLANEVLYESWLFNQSRNWDVAYRKEMTSDEKLPQVISGLFAMNTFTKLADGVSTMERIMNMPKFMEFGKNVSDKSIGQAIRRAFLTYYHISDKDMLDKIYAKHEDGKNMNPAENPLFSKNFMVRKSSSAEKYMTWREPGHNLDGYFDADGKLDPNMREGYMRYLNIFNSIEKDEKAYFEVRERVRQAIIAANPGLSYDDARYAEAWAFSMIRWTGGAARNDIFSTGADADTAVGSDAWSKVLAFDRYWPRQVSRQAPLGMRFQLAGFNRLGVDFLEGTRVMDREANLEAGMPAQQGHSLLYVLQGGDGDTIDLSQDVHNIHFIQNCMRQYSGMHVVNSFNMLHRLLDTVGMGLDKFSKYDPWGRIIIDEEAVGKAFREFYKNMRYAYTTWDLKYDTKVRTLRREMVKENPDGTVQWDTHMDTMTLMESMFSNDILNMMNDPHVERALNILKSGHVNRSRDQDILKQYLKPEDWKKYKEGKFGSDSAVINALRNNITAIVPARDRDRQAGSPAAIPIPKRILMHLIEAEVWYHRSWDSGAPWWGYHDLHRVYGFLEQLPDAVFMDENDFTTMHPSHHFFSKDEMHAMRKRTNTTEGKIFTEATAAGVAEGFGAGFGIFFKELSKFGKSTMQNV